MKSFLTSLILCLILALPAAALENGGFEAGLGQWRFWTRDKGAGSASIDNGTRHSGNQSVRIEHRGAQDWSFEPANKPAVEPGDLYELEVWVRCEGEGTVTLCTSTWNSQGKAVDWSAGARNARSETGWQRLQTRLLVPDGITHLQPRVIGYGGVTAWVDDFEVRKLASPSSRRKASLASTLAITNQWLDVEFHTTNATFSVRDHRSGRVWTQRPRSAGMILCDASVTNSQMRLVMFHADSGLEVTGLVQLSAEEPAFTLELNATGELFSALRFPHPFDTRAGDSLVVPMNEGVSYPVEDESIPLHRLIAYGGHGICMAFWGVTDGAAGHMGILETPDDAAIQMERVERRLIIAPEWDPQKRAFGYGRKLRYVFFDQGGHVAIAKRYRAYARAKGLLKTLAEKRRVNPNVDLLIGAVNVWCWDKDAPAIVREMQAAGIDRILWSNRQEPKNLRELNELGVLTSRYDIYQDVMNPAEFPRLRWVHSDWTTAAWPDDIILGPTGNWIKGWGVEAKDGSMIPCGVICDRQAVRYARERVPTELATHPYRCRFIDTTTAAPWQECYDPRHPMTRTQSREYKMELLRYFSEDLKLVTGCETGHDASVPFLHYFEGMLSLGPYRVPDAGRRMSEIWTNVPEAVAKFQLGERYRLPLWELVYHDCVVAQWYWGDYNNKLPALWDKRDLFNVLYGTPPMFMFDRKLWAANKARFVQSYKNTCPQARRVGYVEMTDHRYLTRDRSVQETSFANGQKVTVNFGSTPYRVSDGTTLNGLGFLVSP